MRRLSRTTLSVRTLKALSRVSDRVNSAQNPKLQAAKSWDSKPAVAFGTVRQALEAMASGRSRCMYCEDSYGTDIDHFWPKADYPARAFIWENYLLACSHCNSNLKRKLFPLDASGLPLLIDPTVENPERHLSLLPSTGEFIALDVKGDESIKVFALNDKTAGRNLPMGRKDALISFVALLKDYDRTVASDANKAEEIRSAAKRFPFSAVLGWLVNTANLPAASIVLDADTVRLVQTHRVGEWL